MYTDLYCQEICPICKKEIYPHEAYRNQYLCGEQLCEATPKLERLLGCHMRSFCSEECYNVHASSPRACSNINYTNHWLDRIIKAGIGQGGK